MKLVRVAPEPKNKKNKGFEIAILIIKEPRYLLKVLNDSGALQSLILNTAVESQL